MRLLCLICLLFFCTRIYADTIPAIDMVRWEQGKVLFKGNCGSCHHVTMAQTGPALNGVTQRWQQAGTYKGKTGQEWLHLWIKNWNDPVAAGYPYAVKMQNYASSQMTIFPYLTDKDIDAILLYVENPTAANKSKGANVPSAPVWPYILPLALLVLIVIGYFVLQAINKQNNKLKGL